MLDLVIRNGTVSTPLGAGSWNVDIAGEAIAAVAAGMLPTEGARIVDAAGLGVPPGGVEPHAHLAHASTSDLVRTLRCGHVVAERGRVLGMAAEGRLLTRRIDPTVLRRPVC